MLVTVGSISSDNYRKLINIVTMKHMIICNMQFIGEYKSISLEETAVIAS
jgi:hypothetical protein